MTKKKTVIYTTTCDRCNYSWNHSDDSVAGYSNVKFDFSAKSYDGAWGGSVARYDLCYACTQEFQNFLTQK